ncbi:unnamed protein product, partial [Cladocopium goreaui]
FEAPDMAEALRGASEDLEVTRQMSCLLVLKNCWTSKGRWRAWLRGIHSLCRAKADPGCARCARRIRRVQAAPRPDLDVVLQMIQPIQGLAAAVLNTSLEHDVPTDDFRRIQVQRAAQSRVALNSLQMDVATVTSHSTWNIKAQGILGQLLGRTVELLESLDRLAHSFPAEIGSMPFQLLYPDRTSSCLLSNAGSGAVWMAHAITAPGPRWKTCWSAGHSMVGS